MKCVLRYLLSLCFTLTVILGWSQTYLELEATAIEEDGRKIDSPILEIYSEDRLVMKSEGNSSGVVIGKMDYDQIYRVILSKPGYEPTVLLINSLLPDSNKKYVYTYAPKIPLIRSKKGMKVKYIGDPVMRVAYLKKKDGFGMIIQFEPTYEYVPDERKPTEALAEAKEVQEEIHGPEDTVKTGDPIIPDAQSDPQAIVDAKRIGLEEERNNQARVQKGKLDEVQRKSHELDLENLLQKALTRRKFLEEIADSKRQNKMLSVGH